LNILILSNTTFKHFYICT